LRSLTLSAALFAIGISTQAAELSEASAKGLAVDVVWLKGGGELRGAFLERDADGQVLMAVRREWFEKADPKRFHEQNEIELKRARKADEELLQRLDTWIARRENDLQLKAVLSVQRQECLDRQKTSDEKFRKPDLMLFELGPDEFRKAYAQPDSRRRLALVAWQLNLADVEKLSFSKLQTSVAAESKDWKTLEVDLSEKLPPLLQNDDEWAARVALWEYTFRQACDLQGTDAFVVRTDNGVARPDVLSLIAPTLGGSLESQLGELFNLDGAGPPPATPASKWKDSSIDIAQKAELSALKATRVNVQPAQFSGSVACDFLVQLPDKGWKKLWKEEANTDVTAVKQDAIDAIRNDPQIQSLQKLFESLGVQGDLDRVLRFGAAVQTAQESVDHHFLRFRDQNTHSLLGPPLRLPRDPAPATAKPGKQPGRK
jgi:hypothetical protein